MRFQTAIIYLAIGSVPLAVASPAPIDALATREAIPETNLGAVLAAAVSKRDDSDVASASFDSHLQEAGGRGKGGYGGGHNGGGNGNGRNGKCYRDALASNGKGGKGKCYRDAFPEVYNDNAIRNRAPGAAAEVLERDDDDDEINTDKLQTDTLGWGRCRRGLDLVDTTGLCCKRGLDGACCNGWILKRDDDDADDKLEVDGWGNNGRCRRNLSGVGRCCVGGY